MSEEKIKCPKCGTECNKAEKFCGECGSDLTIQVEDNETNNNPKVYSIRTSQIEVSPTILVHIGYIIGSIVMAVVFGIGIYFLSMLVFSGSNDMLEFINVNTEGNAFQQIYDLLTINVKASISIGIIFGIALCIVAGLILDFALSTFAKFNAIQKQINETQDLICKHLDIVNERFNVIEDKK